MLKKRVILALFLIFTAFMTSACGGLFALVSLAFPAATEVVNIEDTTPPTPAATPTDTPATPSPSPTATETPAASPTQTPLDPNAAPCPYGPDDKLIAITFDDGPYSGVTTRILNIVEQYAADDVRVTFFVLGIQIAKYPALVARAAKLGCEIGNHTYHHKNLTKISPEEMLIEIGDVNEMVRELTDAEPALVRPPYGARDDSVYATVPYPLILWDIDTLDWSTHDAASTIEAALKCEDGDIILMHDVRADTADAFEALVPQLLERGFKLVTVSTLFAAKGIPLEAGKSYRNAR